MELSVATKKAIIEERLNKLVEDKFKFELNYRFSVEQDQAEAIDQFKRAIDGANVAIEFHKKELASLEG